MRRFLSDMKHAQYAEALRSEPAHYDVIKQHIELGNGRWLAKYVRRYWVRALAHHYANDLMHGVDAGNVVNLKRGKK